MPLNMSDPYLRAERQPPALIELGIRLKTHYGVGSDNFGIRGNEFHYDGFHRSRAFLLKSSQGNGGDYSTRGTLNQGGNENNNCAFDFTPGVWGSTDNRAKMIVLTKRLHDAAVANDTRLADYYEFAGTLDGKKVVTFYAQGGAFKNPFDSTHLDHIHGSKYRSRSDNSDTKLGDVLLGVGSGEEENDMAGLLGPLLMRSDDNDFPMTIMPVYSAAWLNVGGDFGLPAHLRIWVGHTDGSFAPIVGTDGIVHVESGNVLTYGLPTNVKVVSVLRVPAPGSPVGAEPVRAPISFSFYLQYA